MNCVMEGIHPHTDHPSPPTLHHQSYMYKYNKPSIIPTHLQLRSLDAEGLASPTASGGDSVREVGPRLARVDAHAWLLVVCV